MKTIEEINKINEHKSNLERQCENLITLIQEHMTFKEDCTFNNKTSVSFRISEVKSELKKLEQQHLNK
jgi:hypothetical protein